MSGEMPVDEFTWEYQNDSRTTLEIPVTREEPQNMGRHRRPLPRTSMLYVVIVAAWALLCIPLCQASFLVIQEGFRKNTVTGVLTIFTAVLIALFWLNGVKDIVYPIAFRVTSWRSQLPPPRRTGTEPAVVLLYVTCNDFEPGALRASSMQDYRNFQVVILDDSYKPEYIEQVDRYAAEHGIPVVRRADRKGFKAGNLNNFLRSDAAREFEFFVIVDSDEILPRYFISRALDYFSAGSVGIVQANHVATRNRTSFMRMFAPGVDAHWPAYQLVKARAGFLSLLGHGAMISRAAYAAAGGFPEIVAEDIGFAIDSLLSGYRTEFAFDITCEEEFPIDYASFKKRHRKWTEGNMEFMRRYTWRILSASQLSWYERLDILLFVYGLPLTGVFSVYVAINAILFPVTGFRFQFPLWMLIPTVISLFAPMLNDVLTWRKAPKLRLLSYLGHSMILFGSMFFVGLFASVRCFFKGSVFTVTPKTQGASNLKSAVRSNMPELVGGAVLAVIVELATGSILPVILLLIPIVFTVYLSVMNASDSLLDGTSTDHNLAHSEEN